MAHLTGRTGHGPDTIICPGKPDAGRISRTTRTCPDGFPPFRGEASNVRFAPAAVRQIETLACCVERLTISHRDPERFFIERSEIAHGLRELARVLPPDAVRAQRGPEISLDELDLVTKVRT